MKRITALLLSVVFVFVITLGALPVSDSGSQNWVTKNLLPQKAAAITDQALDDIALGQSTCYQMPGKAKEVCLQGFREGYRNINPANKCKGVSSTLRGNCDTGFTQGQKARVALNTDTDNEGNAGSSQTTRPPAPTDANNDAEIKKECEEIIKDMSGDKKELREGCLAGAQGRLDGKDQSQACKFSQSKQNACIKGYDAANKRVDPSEANSTAGGASTKKEIDCDAKLSSILSWIACPIIDQGVAMTDFVFKDIVEPLLADVPVSTNPEDGSYRAWSQFRLIANILLVASLLAVVYSQAKGGK